jgi:peptidoglycan/LPS O-acetylase OafA/YrhL
MVLRTPAMGVLRMFLALSVLNAHFPFSDSIIFINPFVAVCCFFIISGFYMSLVLDGKYRGAVGRFYLNRALRLYPINIALVGAWGLVCCVGILDPTPFKWLQSLQASAGFPPNIAIPLADRLLVFANQILVFPCVLWQNLTLQYLSSQSPLVFGQMYTIGLEVMFYAIAPFIVVRGIGALLVWTILAISVHFGLGAAGLPERPWQYEFFPGILVFFLLGSLSYRLLLIVRDWHYPRWTGYLALPIFFTYCPWPDKHIVTSDFGIDGLYVLTALLIPFLFEASRAARWDRHIGDLSYPVYASQFLVAMIAVSYFRVPFATAGHIVLPVVILTSISLLVAVDYPVEVVRRRIARPFRCTLPQPDPPVVFSTATSD